jgi:hypothetical protein
MSNDTNNYLSHSRPAFICGLPKSGTTLLLSLLDWHSDILVFPEETKFLKQVVSDERHQSFAYLLGRTDCTLLVRRRFADEAGERDYTDFDAKSFRSIAKAYRDHYAEAGMHPARALLEAIVTGYGIVAEQAAPRVWVEKTPLNEVHINEAFKLWPNARAIYLARDPRDVFYSYNAKRRLRGITEMGLDEFELMIMSSLKGWGRAVHKEPTSCFAIRYEDLVTEPEHELRRLAAFLGIPFLPSMLRPTRRGRIWTGNSMHGREFDTISTGSVGAYLTKLDPGVIRELESICARMMRRFGYLPHEAVGTAPAPL